MKEFLQKVITGPASPAPGADLVRELFSNAITAFDNAIAGDVLELFPGGIESLPGRTDEEIQEVLNDFGDGRGTGANYQKARLCLYGTTALVALVDPAHENLWVANLGDCEAGTRSHVAPPPPQLTCSLTLPQVLVTLGADGRLARHEVLNVLHNGTNPAEIARVRHDHPGEPESVQHGRVLGTLAPFRCKFFFPPNNNKRRHHHLSVSRVHSDIFFPSLPNPQASVMRLSSSQQYSPVVYSTTSIPA